MAGSISRSWTLVKASANVLRLDKELMVFPLLSGIATVLVTVSFILPFAVTGGLHAFDRDDARYLAYVVGFFFYLVQYVVIFFFNSALVGAALIRLAGGDPTLSDGLAIAGKRFPSILGYAALAATVGMVVRFISERSGILGRLVVGAVGMAWSLATYLAVPVLVTEDIGPLDAVAESAALFRRTWGEQVVGNFGMGWAAAIVTIAWVLLSLSFITLASHLTTAVMAAAWVVAVSGFVLLALVSSALKGVYTAALYRYASTGEAGFFDPAVMSGAFRPKR
ncbi:MAG: DUF6159 family protein [Gemmatimonadetes bacterium]|nr:DUF6159 family protein [Gemmatimonadota bacterium]